MLTDEQRIGAFFLVGLVLLVLAVELTLGVGLLHHRYTLVPTFRDVQGLDVGADVRVAGIKAGRVEGMTLAGDYVRVALALDRGVSVKKDAVARLDFRALSGERRVRACDTRSRAALCRGWPVATPEGRPGECPETHVAVGGDGAGVGAP